MRLPWDFRNPAGQHEAVLFTHIMHVWGYVWKFLHSSIIFTPELSFEIDMLG
jgi:hypothetical protein